jgi:hypothetical protein
VYLAFVEELATQQGFPAVKAPSFFLVMGPVSYCPSKNPINNISAD